MAQGKAEVKRYGKTRTGANLWQGGCRVSAPPKAVVPACRLVDPKMHRPFISALDNQLQQCPLTGIARVIDVK